MKPYVYVISDIHGQADLFDALLTDYDPVEHQLVLIGDLNDRGSDSKACFLKGKNLSSNTALFIYEAIMKNIFVVSSKIQRTGLQDMFCNGGKETIESLCIQELLQNTHQQKWP